jgi:hypothetical protein
MLEKTLFRKHTKLILFMAERKFFSQKELIAWSLKNKEFRDKDSIENKGQYRDKLISFGVLRKYTGKEFSSQYPEEIETANIAYKDSQERKRCLLVFDSGALIGLDYPKLKELELPLQEYAGKIISEKKNPGNHEISSIVKAFVFGCSIQKIIILNEKISKDLAILNDSRPLITEELLPLVETAREIMEKTIKEKIAAGK